MKKKLQELTPSQLATVKDLIKEVRRQDIQALEEWAKEEKYTWKRVDWGDGASSIEVVEDKTKPRAYGEGYNQALDDLLQKLKDMKP